MQFEDNSTPSLFFDWVVEIELIGHPNETDTERYASCERTKHISKELDSLYRVQLCRAYLFLAAALGDARPPGRAQVADPVFLACPTCWPGLSASLSSTDPIYANPVARLVLNAWRAEGVSRPASTRTKTAMPTL
jgi:hypothetical protein